MTHEGLRWTSGKRRRRQIDPSRRKKGPAALSGTWLLAWRSRTKWRVSRGALRTKHWPERDRLTDARIPCRSSPRAPGACERPEIRSRIRLTPQRWIGDVKFNFSKPNDRHEPPSRLHRCRSRPLARSRRAIIGRISAWCHCVQIGRSVPPGTPGKGYRESGAMGAKSGLVALPLGCGICASGAMGAKSGLVAL